jgi:UDP-N-acetylglucosamine 2-epimerase (non-hydrolysing)
MIVIFYGTSAELIKLYGIVKTIPRDQQFLICNAQQYSGLKKVHAQLNIEPDIYLSHGWRNSDVSDIKQMLGMMLGSHYTFARRFRAIKRRIKQTDKKYGTKSIALVHGDTLTTVVGSYLGKFLGLPVGHIEAGLRSGSWKNPFPEELDRRIAAKFARVHFPPNQLAEDNLKKERVKGVVIPTKFNTAKDAIEKADTFVSKSYAELKLPKSYCLVLLHRTELIESRDSLEAILQVIHRYAQHQPVVFTEHTTTAAKIDAFGFRNYLYHKNITVIHKQPYFDFMAIVKNAEVILTDGGGLQEDSYFLGIPVAVHRERTERQEGIGENAILTEMDVQKAKAFLEQHPSKKHFSSLRNSVSPSSIVVTYLQANGYVKK